MPQSTARLTRNPRFARAAARFHVLRHCISAAGAQRIARPPRIHISNRTTASLRGNASPRIKGICPAWIAETCASSCVSNPRRAPRRSRAGLIPGSRLVIRGLHIRIGEKMSFAPAPVKTFDAFTSISRRATYCRAVRRSRSRDASARHPTRQVMEIVPGNIQPACDRRAREAVERLRQFPVCLDGHAVAAAENRGPEGRPAAGHVQPEDGFVQYGVSGVDRADFGCDRSRSSSRGYSGLPSGSLPPPYAADRRRARVEILRHLFERKVVDAGIDIRLRVAGVVLVLPGQLADEQREIRRPAKERALRRRAG